MLNLKIVSKVIDQFGVIEVTILLNNKLYTFPITSEFALRKVEKLLRNKKPGKALHVLKLFTTTGFNSFKEELNVENRPSTEL